MKRRIVVTGVWVAWATLMAAGWGPLLGSRLPTLAAPPAPSLQAPERVFAVRTDENRVLVLDGSTVSSIAVPRPGALVVAPDGGRFYVVVLNGIAVVDVAAGTIVDTLPAEGVSRLALSGDGRRLFTIATTDQGAVVSGFDLTTRTPLRELAVEWGIVTTAVASPDGVMLYLGHRYYSGIVTFVDLDTHRSWQPPMLEDGVAELALSPDGRHLYAANGTTGSGRVTILDTATGAITAEVMTDSDPASLALDQERRLYTANFSDQSVSAIDIASLRKIDNVAVDPWPASLALSPSGRTLYVAHNGGTLVAVDTATQQATPVPLDPGTTALIAPVWPSSPQAFVARSAAYAALRNWLARLRVAIFVGLSVALAAGVLAGRLFHRSRGGVGVPFAFCMVALGVGAACWAGASWLLLNMPADMWVYVIHRDITAALTPALALLSGAITTALAAVSAQGRGPSAR